MQAQWVLSQHHVPMCDKTGRNQNISERTEGELSGQPLSWSPLMAWLAYGDTGS